MEGSMAVLIVTAAALGFIAIGVGLLVLGPHSSLPSKPR
jgi:hypothetical protein